MENNKGREWRELTFSQRGKKAPLPESLQVGQLTIKFKNRIWLVLATSINDNAALYDSENLKDYEDFFNSDAGKYWKKFYISYHSMMSNIPHDIPKKISPSTVKEWLKSIIFDGEYHEVLTMLEIMLRIEYIPKKIVLEVTSCFKFCPYFIDRSNEPLCIIPITSNEMKENIKQSLDNINKSQLIGAKTHIFKATQELNRGHFADSIRESIHGVEAAIRIIDPKKTKNFNAALNSLEEREILTHPSLKEAFKKLYGYTCDEQGIRHPLLEKETPNVGMYEAIFMYGACVSFIDYLANKSRGR